MPNRDLAPRQEQVPGTKQERHLRGVQTKEGKSLVDQANQIEAWRKEEAEDTAHIEKVRQKISGSDLNKIWSKVEQAEDLLLSEKVTDESLDKLENDLRSGLDIVETVQMELKGTPDSTFRERMMESNRTLIEKLESILEIAGLDPKNAKHEFLKMKSEESKEKNFQQLEARRNELQKELNELNTQVQALERKIEKSGVYGKGISADELSSPAAGLFSRLKTGIIDSWRGMTGKETMLADLRKLQARQNDLAEELHLAPETQAEAETAEQAEAKKEEKRKTMKRHRRDRWVAVEAYGKEEVKKPEELEEEILGKEFPKENQEEKEKREEKKARREHEDELMTETLKMHKGLANMETLESINVTEATRYVPNAKELWDKADGAIKTISKASKSEGKKITNLLNSFQQTGEGPTTNFVYEAARYQKALEVGADKTMLDLIKNRLTQASEKLGLELDNEYRQAVDLDYRKAVERIPHAERFIRLIHEKTGHKDPSRNNPIEDVTDQARDFLVALVLYLETSKKGGNKKKASDAYKTLNEYSETLGLDLWNNALYQSTLGEAPKNKPMASVEARKRQVTKETKRWKF
ncbi:MAG: hypothetical protein ABIB04_03425 [Patescibacteria group bacterium]